MQQNSLQLTRIRISDTLNTVNETPSSFSDEGTKLMKSNLTYEQSFAQRFVLGLEGPQLTQESIDALHHFKVSSILIRGRNIENREQFSDLIDSIRTEVSVATGLTPLFLLLSDAEGEQALKRIMTYIPSNLALSASGDEGSAFSAGRILALELGSLGIDGIIAPSLNVNTNRIKREQGLLCFSDQVDIVSRFGNSMMQGLMSSSMISIAHDFPGFAGTYQTPQSTLRINENILEELESGELYPFTSAISLGMEALMCAPAYYQAFDTEIKISSMSEALIRDHLRGELGFKGVVCTPIIDMPMISDHFPIETVAVESAKSSCDLILLSGNYEHLQTCYSSLWDALSTGYIDTDTHEESVQRILTMKRKHRQQREETDISFLREQHESIASSIIERSLTLVQSQGEQLPDLGTFPIFLSRKREEHEQSPSFAAWMHKRLGGEMAEFSAEIESHEINRMLEEVSDNSAIVILLDAGQEDSSQLVLANALGATGIPTIAVSCGNPYDLLFLHETIESIALFADTDQAYEALLKVLTKERNPTGNASIHW